MGRSKACCLVSLCFYNIETEVLESLCKVPPVRLPSWNCGRIAKAVSSLYAIKGVFGVHTLFVL